MFALLPLAVLLSAAGQNNPEAAGLQALDHQDYQQAEKIFSSIAAADPKDYSALFNLALAETGLRQDDAAAEHYKQVLALKPALYEAELNLGILCLRDHRAADAVPLLRDAAKQKPQQARAQRYLGDGLAATGDLTASAEAYRAALATDPKMAAAELGLGQALARQGKLDEAAPHYRQAAALDPNLKSYELEIAVAFSKANRADDAIALLKDFPGDPGAREELGRLYLESNRPADAVPEFKAAVDMSPTPGNRLALATAYLKNNQPDLAEPILEQALAANPDDYDLHMAVGRIRRDKHDYAVAADQFAAAAKLKPDSIEAWNEAASAFVLAEQYPQALAALDKIHSLNADKPGDYYYRAIVLDKLHQIKPALASYRQFLAMSQGKFPDQEFIARQRSRILEREANR
ncbi:MAG TPA: tetratricopeptide repeat protein [Bryobacteraceae bacterium]|nr:tetratricopeptide repeat protein [Bryobacteraceae bacterium]